ncbi:CCA tRNA nucleotidyltransferase [Lutimaribacter marinistellae]|uniref:CCA tRNA nucleotidyltransferase n=1 Tax=Lutimaribacter marinistellae TaxID=1820329 RepID=A0ABV7TD50_9RHOB
MTRITDDWLHHPATQAVCRVLTDAGAQALFVGGCVRNALLGVAVSDIDITTDARPDHVMRLAEAAGIKAVPTGIDHGTVTLVQDGIPHEVTTFRRDIETDGRRAVIAFSTRIEEDAARRDFTMNALYARPDGEVLDPLGGMPDLRARRVRFIGDAQARIREDYLRSLRYFRFHAWYGDAAAGFDPDALAAISADLDGLDLLSRERVGHEMLKLLGATDPAPSVAAMRATGVLVHLLPGADDTALAPLVHLEQMAGAAPGPLRRLAALGDGLAPGLRLSKAQQRTVEHMREAAQGAAGAAELGYRLGLDHGRDALLLRCALFENAWQSKWNQALTKGNSAEFPVSARDLMPRLKGPELGAELARLERLWIESGFTADRQELLAQAK